MAQVADAYMRHCKKELMAVIMSVHWLVYSVALCGVMTDDSDLSPLSADKYAVIIIIGQVALVVITDNTKLVSYHDCPIATETMLTNMGNLPFNALRPKQNSRHFPDNIFKCIFFNENIWTSIKISLRFVTKGPINNIPALVQIMAWRRPARWQAIIWTNVG